MEWQYDDGGRAAAGFKGQTGDCVTRSIAIATGQDYRTVYDALNTAAKVSRSARGRKSSARMGVAKAVYDKHLMDLGWQWHPTMGIGTGCQVHLATDELPAGRLIVRVSKHMTAVIDGVIHDTFDPQRHTVFYENGMLHHVSGRCVYGYWILRTP